MNGQIEYLLKEAVRKRDSKFVEEKAATDESSPGTAIAPDRPLME